MAAPTQLELRKKIIRDERFESPLPTPVIPGEFFRDSVRSLHEDPFIPTQLRVSTYQTLTTLLPLDNLTYLDISHNDWLTDFPREVVKCTALRKLDISGCKGLVDGRLPGCLAELRNMEWLAADLCDVVAIDLEISTLPVLQHLSIKHNRLDYLPAHLARLYPHLKVIALEGNPCYDSLLPRRIPVNVVEPPQTAPRPSIRRLPSFPRLRHSKSVPNVRRSRSKTLSVMPIRESKDLSPDPQRKSFLKQITPPLPPLPSFSPRRPPRPPMPHSVTEGLRRVRETAEVVGIARDTQWPVGPTPEALTQQASSSRDSDASEESDTNSSIDGSSPASSVSSPLNNNNDRSKNVLPLHGIDEIDIDDRELTLRLLSRLRDLWELSYGDVCLSDHYTPPELAESLEIDEFAQGLGITLEKVDTKDIIAEETAAEEGKKVGRGTSPKRMKIVKEIIDTEESYIRGLQELVDIYIDNIISPLPPPDDFRIVFRHVKTVLNFHQNFFLPALVEATDQPGPADDPDHVTFVCDAIGTVFEEKSDFMKMYFEYINNFDEAIRIVEKWQQKDGSGGRFLKSRMADERHGQLNLLGYLLLPVQRVPRYRLLLADLLNSSDSTSARLRAGYGKVEALARDINERKAEMEGRKRLVELERTVISPPTSPSFNGDDVRWSTMKSKFVDPARRLVKEDSVLVTVRRKKVHGGLTWEKPLSQRCLAVSCSDKLFLCASSELTNQPSQMSMLAEIPLENAIATRCWESSTEWRLVVFDGEPAFDAGVPTSFGGETWRFRADSEEDVTSWIEAIRKASKRVSAR